MSDLYRIARPGDYWPETTVVNWEVRARDIDRVESPLVGHLVPVEPDYEAAIRLFTLDEYEPYDTPYTIHEVMVRRIVDAAFGIGDSE